ncbi:MULTISPECIES: DUF5686 and carboxypeptidase-like regulatory domain-containing protein [unclassified Spirosoma]|uniref:DUF5686 and carboxypeptidase-like regulatory domain-containing protein n=1 Tax=unclassified Spirosoma TaxID=2621999 RepID=UPI000964FAB5|nr:MULTISPECIES: DUF5686 and carboxypeptidase-like regulatory domain-containing protein [unclassified Spirosoma]MBN8826947.1 carboxypeptidase-like regulatory domain-containing protein [Spirosoma sp.]OJW70675.1 MAG: hypothetical protein BGO59_31790 [Spirosoma sp. 48-14]
MNSLLRTLTAIILLLTGWSVQIVAQSKVYTISGQVTDAATGEGIPFASIALKGKTAGTTSDVNGRYVLRVNALSDSLQVLSLGYRTGTYPVLNQATQVIDAHLLAAATSLQEVKVYAKGGDPAYRVMREAVRRGDQYNPAQLRAYQYDSYTKIEAYINNFAQKRKNNKGPGPIGKLLGKLPAITDKNGQPAVPVFISETLSNFYARTNPEKTKEYLLKSHVTGVGVSDGGLIAQLTGASFQQYNFYRNALIVLRKDIPSPIGAQWETIYTYRLKDTVQLNNTVCYAIEFTPKRLSDLAFNGTIWIDTTHFALAQIDAQVDKRANINFVDELHIEQIWETTPSGLRFPIQTQVTIDSDEPTPRSPGALVRFFTSAQNIIENNPKDVTFYDPAIELADDYKEADPAFWQSVRPNSLSSNELRAMRVVDSVRNIPLMKVGGEIIKLGVIGYKPLGKSNLELGPILYSYANNDIEGSRLRLGLRTTTGFSKKWLLSGYVAYGTRDEQLKYSANIEYIISRKPWTVFGVKRSYDLERLGVSADNIGNNSLFAAYSRFGTIRRPYFQEENLVYFRREMGRGFTQTLALRNRSFEPLFPFAFTPQKHDDDQTIRSTYETTELISETRFAPDELILQNDNVRVSTGAIRKPILTLRYTLGLRNVLDGDFTYHRIALTMKHSFRMGVLGRTYYTIGAGIIPSTVPYPLLYMPLGNESSFYVGNAYNLMNYFEFVCDRWATVQFEHNFNGLLFNRLPLLRRLKWRELVTAKVLAGSVSSKNLAMIPATNATGQAVDGFSSLSGTPYVEVGYGIDNIFKVLRIDAVHRLTYRDNIGRTGIPVTPFAIKLSGWLAF